MFFVSFVVQRETGIMNLGGDLKSAKLMYLKAILFLVAGTAAAAGILADSPSLRTALLLGIAVWSFCRLYYFAFYVIEKYIDPGYRFAGLHSFLLYLWQQRTAEPPPPDRRSETSVTPE